MQGNSEKNHQEREGDSKQKINVRVEEMPKKKKEAKKQKGKRATM